MDFSVRAKEPRDALLLPLRTVQEHGAPAGALGFTVNDQGYPQHLRPHGSPAAQPWPRREGEEDEEEEEEEVRYGITKLKMFEMGPLDDPVMEERRQRAIYAKRNREMKKREMEELQREAAALQSAGQQCQAEVTRLYCLTQTQQREIQELKQCLSGARQQLRVKEQELLSNQQKLSRMRAHLEMIAEGSDDSMTSRMILNLLANSS